MPTPPAPGGGADGAEALGWSTPAAVVLAAPTASATEGKTATARESSDGGASL